MEVPFEWALVVRPSAGRVPIIMGRRFIVRGDLSGRRPRFRIFAEAEKGRQDRLLPITPDFAEFLYTFPSDERTGHVFKLHGTYTGAQMTSARAGRVISDIGKRAKVMVNKTEQKFASAHDLRRSYGTR